MNTHKLTDGLDPQQQAELGDIDSLQNLLEQYHTPSIETTSLLASLITQMPPVVIIPTQQRGLHFWFRLAQSQISFIKNGIAWLSAILFMLGIGIILSRGSDIAAIYTLISPMIAVSVTAIVFRSDTQSLREFELLSAVQPLELLYSRLLLILIYNSTLAIFLIALGWVQGTELILWRLIILWIGPMIGLTGIALYSTLRWNTLVGIFIPMILWAGFISLQWREQMFTQTEIPFDRSLVTMFNSSNSILLLAIGILVTGVVFLWKSHTWVDPSAKAS